MELLCDHTFKHPPCLGRDANGASVTTASGVYTTEMVFMIVAIIDMLSPKMLDSLNTVSNRIHEANASSHEHHRIEAYVPFEDATRESYLLALSMR